VDIVVANLPYVKESELGHLPTFEPELAFNGGPEGLDVITDFIAQLKGKLRNGGVVLLEVGLGQAGAVADLLKHYRSDIRIEIISDFSRIDRVVCGFLA
jgi:release factor glutamine methyltransferase